MAYEQAEIRRYITESFSDPELNTFCFDYFPEVNDEFTQGLLKSQKVMTLISFCLKRNRIPDLLAALKRERPGPFFIEPLPKPLEYLPETAVAEPSPTRNPRQIFIGYAHQDTQIANQLGSDLDAHNWDVWMAPQSIRPGEKWVEAINRGLKESSVFVLLLTEAAIKSKWVSREANLAIHWESQNKIEFIPLRMNSKTLSDMPALWEIYQQVRFDHNYSQGLEALLAKLEPSKFTLSKPLESNESKKKSDPENEQMPPWLLWAGAIILAILLLLFLGNLLLGNVLGQGEDDRATAVAQAAATQTANAMIDSDNDGLTDAQEEELCTHPEQSDSDNDGLDDRTEVSGLTEPCIADSDNDGLLDGEEINMYGTNPINKDHDLDGLFDGDEVKQYKTDPLNRDTDGDGNSDGDEITNGSDPNRRPTITPVPGPTKEPIISPTPTISPTKNPVITPNPTVTLDTNLPPPNPTLGSTWVRPEDNMPMVYVDKGKFSMGDYDTKQNEQPVHDVSLEGFWFDKHEVNNTQFVAFLNIIGNQMEKGLFWLDIDDEDNRIEFGEDKFQVQQEYANHPVIEVTWFGARAYCEWVGGILPTEAQWEYTARGPDAHVYPWGSQLPSCELANYAKCGGKTTQVDGFANGRSWIGALHMAGNVWEWVVDWYDNDYYETSSPENPFGPAEGNSKVARGGSWYNYNEGLRSSFRKSLLPIDSYPDVGFRCAYK